MANATATKVAPSAPDDINAACFFVIATMVATATLGLALDGSLRRRRQRLGLEAGDAPQCWVVGATACSYVFLVVGLLSTLFTYNVSVTLFGITKVLKEGTETMVELIQRLNEQGMLLGAAVVAFYAVFIPVAKLVLLILIEAWRRSKSRTRVKWAGYCIRLVKVVSKWACPDLFAYILMSYLFRSINHQPTVSSGMRLEVGFVCFGVFCLGSTFSSLGIRSPVALKAVVAEEALRPSRCAPLLGGPRGPLLLPLTLVLVAACLFLLSLGLTRPCMSLHLDLDLLIQVKPDLEPLRPLLEAAHLPELLRSGVSIRRCTASLAQWALDGEVASALAFVLLAVFVVALTVLDVLVLVALSVYLACGRGRAVPGDGRALRRALRAVKVLRKLSMLDVAIMGVMVVVVTLSDLRKRGVIVTTRPGLLLLIGAEVCHYVVFFLVTSAARTALLELGRGYKKAQTESELSETGSPSPTMRSQASTSDTDEDSVRSAEEA